MTTLVAAELESQHIHFLFPCRRWTAGLAFGDARKQWSKDPRTQVNCSSKRRVLLSDAQRFGGVKVGLNGVSISSKLPWVQHKDTSKAVTTINATKLD